MCFFLLFLVWKNLFTFVLKIVNSTFILPKFLIAVIFDSVTQIIESFGLSHIILQNLKSYIQYFNCSSYIFSPEVLIYMLSMNPFKSLTKII